MNSVSPLGCRKVVYKDSERTPDELLAIENDQVMSKISACTGFSIWLSTSIVIGSKREKTRPFSPQGLLVASEKKHFLRTDLHLSSPGSSLKLQGKNPRYRKISEIKGQAAAKGISRA